MAFTEDLSAFFDTTQGFADSFTFGAVVFAGIFDNGYEAPHEVHGTAPRILCAASSVTSLANGTTCTHAGTTYAVREIRPDGTGLAHVILERA